jgi:hypothetical protein
MEKENGNFFYNDANGYNLAINFYNHLIFPFDFIGEPLSPSEREKE